MQAASLVPQSGPIMVHWGWFEGFMLITFVAHLLFMNAALGGGAITLLRSLRGRGGSAASHDFAVKMPTLLALTVNFGVAPLLFMQVLYGHFFYVSDILIAFFWLSVIVLIILAYYAAYAYDFKFDSLGAGRAVLLGVAVLFMLGVAFIFSNNLTLMMTPERWLRYFDESRGILMNLTEPTLFPRWLHFMVAALAIGGLFLAVSWKFKVSRGTATAEEADEHITAGMRWFAWATASQLLFGVLFLISLPRDVMLLFMMGETLHTVVFLAALASVGVTLGMAFRRSVWGSAAAVSVTVLLMATMRELVRQAYLQPYFHPSQMESLEQYGPLVLFLVSLVAGVAVVGWVLAQALKAGKEA